MSQKKICKVPNTQHQYQRFVRECQLQTKCRGANLSRFGEIRHFHLEIDNSRESCRSVKKIEEGGGGVVVISASHLCHVTCSVFFPCWQWQEWTRPTLSLIGLPWGRRPHRCRLSRIFFMIAIFRTKNTF